MSVNKVILIGRLGNDPESKVINTGKTVTTLNLATSRNWKDQEGNRQEKTEWHRIVVWGRTAETCAQYLSKGRQIYVEGELQTRSWETENGQKRYTTEVVAQRVQFLSSSESNSERGAQKPDAGADSKPNFDVEDLPF